MKEAGERTSRAEFPLPSPPEFRAAAGRFPGLNGLRACAALFVLLGHIPMNQAASSLPNPHWGAAFYRGEPAVLFFFTLSGFLITYLLLHEQRRRGTISVEAFYVRRILRIWPVYFLVVTLGLVFYNGLLPLLGIPYAIEYSLLTAIPLYLLFLPNLMSSLYSVGGILNPTWSIGVEEQFYLGWAPLVKRYHRELRAICWTVLLVFLVISFAVHQFRNELGLYSKFFGTLKFHFMAAGGLVAVALFERKERLLDLGLFRLRWAQWILWALLAEFYFVGQLTRTWALQELVQLALYPWLLVEIAANPRRLFSFSNARLESLGEVSYGIYMYHMFVVYGTSWLFLNTSWWKGSTAAYLLGYYALAVGGTIAIAYLSHRLFEAPLLRLKGRFGR